MYEVQRGNEDASASLALVCMAFLSVSSYLVLLIGSLASMLFLFWLSPIKVPDCNCMQYTEYGCPILQIKI
jgi:hypothetical protein